MQKRAGVCMQSERFHSILLLEEDISWELIENDYEFFAWQKD